MISKKRMLKIVNKINKQVTKADLIGEIWVNTSWDNEGNPTIVVTFFYFNNNFSVYLYNWEDETMADLYYNFVKFILKNYKKLYQEYIEKELFKEFKKFEDYLLIRSGLNVDLCKKFW